MFWQISFFYSSRFDQINCETSDTHSIRFHENKNSIARAPFTFTNGSSVWNWFPFRFDNHIGFRSMHALAHQYINRTTKRTWLTDSSNTHNARYSTAKHSTAQYIFPNNFAPYGWCNERLECEWRCTDKMRCKYFVIPCTLAYITITTPIPIRQNIIRSTGANSQSARYIVTIVFISNSRRKWNRGILNEVENSFGSGATGNCSKWITDRNRGLRWNYCLKGMYTKL